jgi:hypothetical protein
MVFFKVTVQILHFDLVNLVADPETSQIIADPRCGFHIHNPGWNQSSGSGSRKFLYRIGAGILARAFFSFRFLRAVFRAGFCVRSVRKFVSQNREEGNSSIFLSRRMYAVLVR